MSCLHQKRVMQPEYSCTDFTGVEPWARFSGASTKTCSWAGRTLVQFRPFLPSIEMWVEFNASGCYIIDPRHLHSLDGLKTA